MIATAFLALYGISAAFLPTNGVVFAVQLFSVAMAVLSVYSMVKAGEGLGDALEGDYSEKEKAEMFGRTAVMLLLAAGGVYGSLTVVMQPKMLAGVVEHTKEAMRLGAAQMKSFVQIFTIRDVESMAAYCKEFVSDPALVFLQGAAQGKEVRQLHELAKVVREASGKVERALMEDELAAAVESWQNTGRIREAAQAVMDWIKLKELAAGRKGLKYQEVNIHGNLNTEIDSVDLVNQVIFEDKYAKNLYMDQPDCPQTEGQWAKKTDL